MFIFSQVQRARQPGDSAIQHTDQAEGSQAEDLVPSRREAGLRHQQGGKTLRLSKLSDLVSDYSLS